MLLAFVARRVGDGHAAEDITQDIMLRVHRRVGTLREPGALTAWMYQIARNAITDHYRRTAASRELAAGIDLADGRALSGSPPQDAPGGGDGRDPRSELAGCLAPLVAELPDRYREAITLTDLEGLTQAAAASRLRLSVSGTKSRVQRARTMLRQRLTDCCQVEQDRRGAITAYQPAAESRDHCVCGVRAAARSATSTTDQDRA